MKRLIIFLRHRWRLAILAVVALVVLVLYVALRLQGHRAAADRLLARLRERKATEDLAYLHGVRDAKAHDLARTTHQTRVLRDRVEVAARRAAAARTARGLLKPEEADDYVRRLLMEEESR